MIEDGRAYAVALIIQGLLKRLEQKGVLSRSEKVSMLDDISDQIRQQAQEEILGPVFI